MTQAIETAEQARAYLKKDVRKGFIMSAAAFVGVQVLITLAMLGSTYMDLGFVSFAELEHVVVVGRRGGSPMRFWPLFWLSFGVFAAIFVAFGAWFTGRRIRRARRILPLLEQGTRLQGTVTGLHTESEQRNSMQYNRLRLTVQAQDGREFHATHEEPIGTELPQVPQSSAAVVWTSPSGYVIAAGGVLFHGP